MRTIDVRLDRVAIRALEARRDERRAVEPVVDADLIVGLIDIRARAETRPAEYLLAALLSLGAQGRVGAREQRTVRAPDGGAGANASVQRLLERRIIASGDIDRLIDGKGRRWRRIAQDSLGGCLRGSCNQT